MPIATIHKMGQGDLYMIHFLERTDPGFGHGGGGVDPGYDRPIHHPGHPDHGLPSTPGHHPDHGLPGGGHISNRPPGSYPGRPDNALPGAPGSPGNELPANPPPTVAPGTVVVMIRSGDGKWHYAAIQPGSPPPRPLPEPPGVGVWPKPPGVDNTLPGAPVYPDNTLPPAPTPKA